MFFTSDLIKTVNSADIAFPGIPKIQDKRLRECNYGDFDGEDKELVIYEEHKWWISKDVEKRVRSFINEVLKEYKGKTIGIVSHRAPQLSFEVITKNITFEEANKNDWRKTGDWRPRWRYDIDKCL